MGRALRKVIANWEHPKNERGYIPLKDRNQLIEDTYDYLMFIRQVYNTQRWSPKDIKQKPDIEKYMPFFDEIALTCIQLYETTSEGTPITPVFQRSELEQLCEYAEQHCYTVGEQRGTKETWMEICKVSLSEPEFSLSLKIRKTQMVEIPFIRLPSDEQFRDLYSSYVFSEEKLHSQFNTILDFSKEKNIEFITNGYVDGVITLIE